MTKRFLIATAAVLAMALSAAEANAATILLDFTNVALYGGANGSNNFTQSNDQGVSVNLQSTLGNLTQSPVSGLGVNNDEISCVLFLCETVVSGFSPSQYVHDIFIAKLFDDRSEDETGYYSLNGGAWTPFFANSATGLLTISIEQANISSISFATNVFDVFGLNDFAVKGISVEGPGINPTTPVPEPASMILLGSGLMGAAMARRRKKNPEA